LKPFTESSAITTLQLCLTASQKEKMLPKLVCFLISGSLLNNTSPNPHSEKLQEYFDIIDI
jgi:hypothetical protein